MNKKMIAASAVIFFLAAAVIGGVLFFGVQKEKPEEKKPEHRTEEEQNESAGEKDDTAQYKFENLGNIFYLPDERDGFERQAAGFLKENGIGAEKINALGKYKDDPSDEGGNAEFYLQADDEEHSIVKVTYDKGRDEFSFSLYDGEIENIEDYGGVPVKKDGEQTSDPEYDSQGLEEMDFGLPVITDNEGQLAEVEADPEALSSQMLGFLTDNSEERRNLSVLYAASTETGYEAAWC